MIHLKNVSKQYKTNQYALKNINLSLDKGEMAFLIGHSGAGKSTLLKIIALIEQYSSGKAIVGNLNLKNIAPSQIPFYRRRLGIIFQKTLLLKEQTIFDNVAMPLIIAGYNRHDCKKRVRAALSKVNLLKKQWDFPESLSGGEQQRIGIARAVVHRPKILLADEPTGNLDPELSAEILSLFENFNRVGVTTLIATHDTVLHEGKRVFKLDSGTLEEVCESIQ